jgi:hypothetical protein
MLAAGGAARGRVHVVGNTGVDFKKLEADESFLFMSSSLALTPLSLSSDNRAWASDGASGSIDRPSSIASEAGGATKTHTPSGTF